MIKYIFSCVHHTSMKSNNKLIAAAAENNTIKPLLKVNHKMVRSSVIRNLTAYKRACCKYNNGRDGCTIIPLLDSAVISRSRCCQDVFRCNGLDDRCWTFSDCMDSLDDHSWGCSTDHWCGGCARLSQQGLHLQENT